MDILLTMSLLVVLAALAWPSMGRPLANQRLRKAADQIRSEMTRARVKAMSTGRTYVFQYSPNEERYSLRSFGEGESLSDDAIRGGGSLESGPLGQEGRPASERPLPDGVTFDAASYPETPSASSIVAGDLADPAGGAAFGVDSPPTAIRFYADGTTSSARVRLKNEFGRSIELRLRGLTGVITVGEVTATAEVPQP